MDRDVAPAKVSARPAGFIPEEEEEENKGVVVSPADLQLLKETEKKSESGECSAGDIFLAASYVTLLLDLFSSGFTLWCTKHPQSSSLILKVTLAYYGLYLMASAVLVANSVVELKELKEREKELEDGERRIKNSMEYLTAISAALWIVLCFTSMLMSVDIHNAALQYSSLVISLIAPLMGSFAAFLRVHDTYRAYKKEKQVEKSAEVSEALKARAGLRAKGLWVRAALYGVIAAFEFLHFIGHIWEAYLLVGNTHRLFYITDEVFLISQVMLGVAFIVLAVVERVLENKTEHYLVDDEGQALPAANTGGEPEALADDEKKSIPGTLDEKECGDDNLSVYGNLGSVQAILTDLSDEEEVLKLDEQEERPRQRACKQISLTEVAAAASYSDPSRRHSVGF